DDNGDTDGNDDDGDNDDNDDDKESERVYTPPEFVPTHEEEKIDDEEKMNEEEEDDEVTKELYKDVNVNLGNKDADMTNA
ncbi:hypothetical protein Tco_0538874, partial [Tanacetum coccineum]